MAVFSPSCSHSDRPRFCGSSSTVVWVGLTPRRCVTLCNSDTNGCQSAARYTSTQPRGRPKAPGKSSVESPTIDCARQFVAMTVVWDSLASRSSTTCLFSSLLPLPIPPSDPYSATSSSFSFPLFSLIQWLNILILIFYMDALNIFSSATAFSYFFQTAHQLNRRQRWRELMFEFFQMCTEANVYGFIVIHLRFWN